MSITLHIAATALFSGGNASETFFRIVRVTFKPSKRTLALSFTCVEGESGVCEAVGTPATTACRFSTAGGSKLRELNAGEPEGDTSVFGNDDLLLTLKSLRRVLDRPPFDCPGINTQWSPVTVKGWSKEAEFSHGGRLCQRGRFRFRMIRDSEGCLDADLAEQIYSQLLLYI